MNSPFISHIYAYIYPPSIPNDSHIYHIFPWNSPTFSHWIGLRENLQETMVFTIKYGDGDFL